LITQYEVLKGTLRMKFMWRRRSSANRRAFRRAPELYGADRGFFSEHNVTACVQGAVNTICIPQRGGSKTPQPRLRKIGTFNKAKRFRAGIEAHLGVDARARHEALPAEGRRADFALFVGRGGARQQPHDLAALLTKRSSRRSKAAR